MSDISHITSCNHIPRIYHDVTEPEKTSLIYMQNLTYVVLRYCNKFLSVISIVSRLSPIQVKVHEEFYTTSIAHTEQKIGAII